MARNGRISDGGSTNASAMTRISLNIPVINIERQEKVFAIYWCMIKLKEIIGKDIPPPIQRFDDPDEEMGIALKQPFLAWSYALRYGPHPKLWGVIRGSPYETQYVKKFGNK